MSNKAAQPKAPVHGQVPHPAGRALRAVYASDPETSRGRAFPEAACPTRTPFQRDRDRIVHSSAFRRLTHKTQVFIYHEGDHYRSRMTHSIEVAQIARAISRLLGLDEDLAESVALAHDLGHPPFGHAGERALNGEMADFGGFDHNAQSLRVVTLLEKKYADFDGLNLSWETLEGIIKHNGPLVGDGLRVKELAPLPETIRAFDKTFPLDLATQASGEAQAAAVADDIAYNNHDLDDGLRAGLVELAQLRDIALTEKFLREVADLHGDLAGPRAIYEVNRRLITAMVVDTVDETRRRIESQQVTDRSTLRHAPEPVIAFSEPMRNALNDLREFLFVTVYRDRRVMAIMGDAEQLVQDLFRRYMAAPDVLPKAWAGDAVAAGLDDRARLISDYVAGMTDRFAMQEHRRLFDVTPDLR